MSPPPKALALRPAMTPAVPELSMDRPKPADRRDAPTPMPSNAAVLAAVRSGMQRVPAPPPNAQDTVGNGAVVRIAKTPAPSPKEKPATPAPQEKPAQEKEKPPADDQPQGKPTEKPVRLGPESDPKFLALKKDVARKKRAVATSHQAAPKEAEAAQKAARPPKDDKEAQGKTVNADRMNEAEPKKFDKAAFVQAVKDAVKNKTPQTLDDAEKFVDTGKPEEIKAEVHGKVGEGKNKSAEEIATTTAAPPDTSAAKTKDVVPLTPDRPPGTPAAPNAAHAVPDTLPPSATDMSAGPAQVDQEMANAQVTEPQLVKSNEPTFKKALAEKKTAEQHAGTAPDQLRKHEAAELKQGTAQARRLGMAAMGSMGAKRVRTGQQVDGGKTGAKTRDEDKRAEVTAILQGVFDTMKIDVENILSGLDEKVDKQFTDGEDKARKQFKLDHFFGMMRYKSRRYSGWGFFKAPVDFFAGLPPEANQVYTDARERYVQAMEGVISGIAETIDFELGLAKARIKRGREDMQTALRALPKDLQAIGREAAAEFDDQFDDLTHSVDDKATELVDTLATRYSESLKEVDQEIAEEKEKNKGLVAKAIDAVKDVIQTIKDLKNLLMAVLAKARQAILDILADPIGFLGNLVSAVGSGVRLFIGNIGKHLQQGILSWLLGRTAEAGLQLPDKFDTRGVFLMIAGLLGVSWQNIRARITRRVPEQAVTAAETAVPLVAKARTHGPGGLWDELKPQVGDLRKELIDKSIDYAKPTILVAGMTWVLSLFNPASAFIRAMKMIIDIIQFIVSQARQIIDFVNAVLDAVIAIAKGSGGGVPAMVEKALARSIPLLLGLLAAILGVGGIAARVKKIVQDMSRPVNRAIDRVVNTMTDAVKKLWAKIKPKPDKPKSRRAEKAWPERDRRKPDPRKPDRRKADQRKKQDAQSDKELQRILDAALHDARELVRERLPVDQIKRRLPAIRRRHRLTGLAVVVDRLQGTTHFVHFVATINPSKETRPEGTEVAVEQVRAEYGILVKNQEMFQKYANERQLIIEVRLTNTHSLKHLEHPKTKRRAVYKPQDVKAGTLDERDLPLRVKRKHLGLAGFFYHPPKPEALRAPPGKFEAAVERLNDRITEKEKYETLMRSLAVGRKIPGRYDVFGYVVYGYDWKGHRRPVAGDHDLFSIRNADGTPLDKDDLASLIEEMKDKDFGVMHGTILEWDLEDPRSRTTPEENRKTQLRLIAKAAREGVVRFTPGQPAKVHYPPLPSPDRTDTP